MLYGTNLGDANTHVTTNLPVLFAGGGFRHGQHLAFDRERNPWLAWLFEPGPELDFGHSGRIAKRVNKALQ